MGAKRAWMALPAGLGAALAVVIGAPAATHGPLVVRSARVSGKAVVFTVDVTVTGACKGAVKLSAAGRHWKGPAKKSGGACHATIRGSLPKADYGKKLTFHFAFAHKTHTAKVTLTQPTGPVTQPTGTTATDTTPTTPTDTTPTQTGPGGTPPPGYVNGSWTGSLVYPDGGNVQFFVVDGVIQQGLQPTTNGFLLNCTDPMDQPVTTYYVYHYRNAVPLDSGGSFSASYQHTADPATSGNGTGEDMHMSVSGNLGNGTGTMTLGAAGTIYTGHADGQTPYDYTKCTGTNTFPVYKSS